MVDIKVGGQTLWRFNTMPNKILGIQILQDNGQDQIVPSGNYCCSSIRVASIDENKNSHWKITMTNTQTKYIYIYICIYIWSYFCTKYNYIKENLFKFSLHFNNHKNIIRDYSYKHFNRCIFNSKCIFLTSSFTSQYNHKYILKLNTLISELNENLNILKYIFYKNTDYICQVFSRQNLIFFKDVSKCKTVHVTFHMSVSSIYSTFIDASIQIFLLCLKIM